MRNHISGSFKPSCCFTLLMGAYAARPQRFVGDFAVTVISEARVLIPAGLNILNR